MLAASARSAIGVAMTFLLRGRGESLETRRRAG